jgi:hypothetical protein
MVTLLMMCLPHMTMGEKRHLLLRVGAMKRLCKEILALVAVAIINNQERCLNKKNLMIYNNSKKKEQKF